MKTKNINNLPDSVGLLLFSNKIIRTNVDFYFIFVEVCILRGIYGVIIYIIA